MSLLTSYNNGLGTQFTSVSYGSSQPYVTVDIVTGQIKLLRKAPVISDILNILSDISIDGTNLISTSLTRISRAAIDVNRIGNFLTDPLKGPLFVATQEAVQLMNVVPNLGDSNTGAQLYNPLSSIINTALQGVGGHDRRTISSPLLSAVGSVVSSFISQDSVFNNLLNELSADTYQKIYKDPNRVSALVSLYNTKYTSDDTNWYSYLGGPDSFLGIGETTIRRYINTPQIQSVNSGLNMGFITESPPDEGTSVNPKVPFKIITSIVKGVTTWKDNPPPITYSNYYDETITVSKKNWKDINRETRVGSGRQDSINLTPIFNTLSGDVSNFNYVVINNKKYTVEDLAKFRIEAVDPNNLSSNWMVFRAYISRFSDDYTSDWNGTKYTGRGESFYTYGGYTRQVGISFKVASLSENEMMPMYQKLNYLASNMAPEYGSENIMKGPFMKITVGNYLYRQPCIINSMTYNVPQESPWEIAMIEPDFSVSSSLNANVLYELPHIIEVSMTITPIGIGPNAQIPKKDTGTPFIAYKTKGSSPAENIWFTNYYNNQNTGSLSPQTGTPSTDGSNSTNGNK